MTIDMNLYPTSNEMKIFEDYLNHFAYNEVSCTAEDRISIHTVLAPWVSGKNVFLFSLFKDRLIYKKPIEFEVQEDELISNMKKLVETDVFCSAIDMKLFEIMYPDKVFALFNKQNDDIEVESAREIRKLFFPGNLIKKTVPFNFPNSLIINGNILKNTGNMKIMKIMKWVAKVLNCEKDFEEFRIKHSQILNQKKIKGNLCLSIHPLDYITMSDNACGWSSCMRWYSDEDTDCGEYRRGTLEMMNSSKCVVAYIESDQKYKWGNEEHQKWNSKKWRELFYVDDEFIISNTSYPYENRFLEKKAFNMLRQIAHQNLNLNFSEEPEYFSLREPISNKDLIIRYITMRIMYNDFGRSDHKIMVEKNAKCGERILSMEAPVYCLNCGMEILNSGKEVICNDCEGTVECFYCGEKISLSDALYDDDGNPCCDYCYDEEVYD